LHERFFCFAPQRSVSLTPPSARRKRQASCYRSGHVFSFAGNGLPISVFMASTPKKGSKNTKAKPRRAVLKTSVAGQGQTNGELRQQLAEALEREKAALKKLQDRDQQLAEALEQQTSTNEILGIIANSATDLQPVLDAVAENAARLIDAH